MSKTIKPLEVSVHVPTRTLVVAYPTRQKHLAELEQATRTWLEHTTCAQPIYSVAEHGYVPCGEPIESPLVTLKEGHLYLFALCPFHNTKIAREYIEAHGFEILE